jgi:hypothetical protein
LSCVSCPELTFANQAVLVAPEGHSSPIYPALIAGRRHKSVSVCQFHQVSPHMVSAQTDTVITKVC